MTRRERLVVRVVGALLVYDGFQGCLAHESYTHRCHGVTSEARPVMVLIRVKHLSLRTYHAQSQEQSKYTNPYGDDYFHISCISFGILIHSFESLYPIWV